MKLNLKNRKYYKEVLALFFLLMAIYFIRQEQQELKQAINILSYSYPPYILLGLLITLIFILLNGLMYVSSFQVVHKEVPLAEAIKLFLKRNLISVFLPGGGITSLAFFTKEIEKQGVSKSKISFASYIYGITGIASLVLISIPVLVYLGFENTSVKNVWPALIILLILIGVLSYLTFSLFNYGWIYKKLIKISPPFELIISEIKSGEIAARKLFYVLFYSTLIELAGMAHIYIAMLALNLHPNIEASIEAYVIATLFLCISPFLRGLGAVEVSLTYILSTSGYSATEAISITILYRIFEFWLPLVFGAGSFIVNKGNIVLRIFPAILIFLLGVVNIISVLTPPIAQRLKLLNSFLPVGTIHASNFLILVIGIILMALCAFMLRGFKNAWRLAFLLSAISFIGHLTKAIDYEESLLALLVLIVLWITRKQYYIKGDRNIQSFGTITAFWILVAVIVYGCVGFYFLDERHFNINFSFSQSVKHTLQNFILIDSGIVPKTRFARGFLLSLNVFGLSSIALVFYTYIKPYVLDTNADDVEFEKARVLVQKYGHSPVDYFKTYDDKKLFFSPTLEGFVAYKYAKGIAIALEEPVCKNETETKKLIIAEFEKFCFHNGLKAAWYRVDESSLDVFEQLNKKSLLIGQEAVVNAETFSLEGKDKKAFRNSLNSLQKKNFKTHIYSPPIKDGLLQKLKLVSDDWLESLDRDEMVFSQGMFLWTELKKHTIITLENEDEKVVAFLNIIPDYAPNEITYDLIRKTADAPAGNMDALIIELINYCRSNHTKYLNMGLAPLSGIDQARDFPERTIKFAYNKLQQFKHYKGLRDFKDKFNPQWHNKYLIYNNHYDLLQLPTAITKIMKA